MDVTIHYPNKIESRLVTIAFVPMPPFTSKSTSKLRSALHFRYIDSHASHASFPGLILLNPNNHYNHGFHNTLDYNSYFLYNDYLLCTVPVSAHIIR